MITYRKCLKNIRKILAQATETEVSSGTDWYLESHRQIKVLAEDYKIPIDVASAVVAVLSPGIRWEHNIEATRKVCREILCRGPESRFASVPGYPHNVDKGKLILSKHVFGLPWEYLVTGPKVNAFYHQLLNPYGQKEITIDVHAFSIAAGRRFTTKSCPNVTPLRRYIISRAFRTVAKEAGIPPVAVQAITWLCWRRLHT